MSSAISKRIKWVKGSGLFDVKGNSKNWGEGSVNVLAPRAGTLKFDRQCKSQVWWLVFTISVPRRQRWVALWGSLTSNTSYLVEFQTNGKHHLKNIKTKPKNPSWWLSQPSACHRRMRA